MTDQPSTTVNKAELAARIAGANSENKGGLQKGIENLGFKNSTDPTPPSDLSKLSYQFPSAPTTFKFPWDEETFTIPEGVYTPKTEREREYLDKMVRIGTIGYRNRPSKAVEHTIPPIPGTEAK